jgi:uncharacterized protein (TIGR03067 family)
VKTLVWRAVAAGVILGLALALALAGGDGQKGPDPKSDRDQAALQGTWKWQSASVNGEALPANEVVLMSMTFKGDQVMPSADPTDTATFHLDPSKTPATIDFIDHTNKVDLGIYKIDGDVLSLCMSFAQSLKARPAAFESTKENGALYVVMKKQPAGK